MEVMQANGEWPENIENINSAPYLWNDDGFPIAIKFNLQRDWFVLMLFFLSWFGILCGDWRPYHLPLSVFSIIFI